MEKIDLSIKSEIYKMIEEKASKENRSISSVCRIVIEEYYKRYGIERSYEDAK